MASHAQLSLAEIQKELFKLHKIAKEATHGRDIAEVCRRSMARQLCLICYYYYLSLYH